MPSQEIITVVQVQVSRSIEKKRIYVFKLELEKYTKINQYKDKER